MSSDNSAPMKTEIPKMKHVCLLYLDILGYKDFIQRNGYNKSFEIINSAFELSKLYKDSLNDYLGSGEIKFKGYSDNLVFYFELKEDGADYKRFYALASLASNLQESFVTLSQSQLRGAITVGNCYIEDYIFGEAFMEAFDLESNKADWGRVVVSKEAFHSFRSPNGNIVVPCLIDNDMFYLDFLAMSLNPVANENYKQHFDYFYRIFRKMYFDVIDKMVVAKTLGEMIQISKIVEKNNRMLDYISSYSLENGLEIKEPHIYKQDKLLCEWNEFQSQLNSVDEESISAVRESLNNLLKVFNVYRKSLDENRETLRNL